MAPYNSYFFYFLDGGLNQCSLRFDLVIGTLDLSKENK